MMARSKIKELENMLVRNPGKALRLSTGYIIGEGGIEPNLRERAVAVRRNAIAVLGCAKIYDTDTPAFERKMRGIKLVVEDVSAE